MLKKRLLHFLLALCLLCNGGLLSFTEFAGAIEGNGENMKILNIGATAKIMIQACSDDIIRVRYSPNGVFRDKDIENDETLNTYTVTQDWDYDGAEIIDDGTILTVATPKIKAEVTKATGKVVFKDADGNLILSERNRASSNVTMRDQSVWYSVEQEFLSDSNEALYGFGNINNTIGIKGQNITIRQENTNKRTPMFYSNMGYGILFDITSNGQLTWSDSNSVYKYTGNAADSMDYYFFYGPDADSVISGYRTVTGKATMLPKNAYGYVHSRNRYGSQNDLVAAVDKFRTKNIPVDTIVIDYQWWDGRGEKFNNITKWDTANWPDPVKMMNDLHNRNVTASISVWPSFREGTETYNYILENKPDFLMSGDGNGFGRNYDASSKSNRDFYWDMINTNVFSKGLDSIWLDANEPERGNWSQNGGDSIAFGDTRPIAAMFPLLTDMAVYNGQRAIASNTKRVNTLSRAAVAGVQRYGIQSWSGDIQSTWSSLKAEIAGVVNFSASGIPFFSTDTGGYHGVDVNNPDVREMILRWQQFSTFTSIMRMHGTSNKEPWNLGTQYEGYLTEYIKLRERLMPYTYSLVGETVHNDYSMVRPMIFDFREDDNVKNLNDQYMYGPAMLAAPVTDPGARSREVYLPEGKWIDFWTGMTTNSTGESFTVDAPLTQMPVFVKAGSVVPMAPHMQYASEILDPTELRVYMGADGEFTLYEDEGDNYNYENGDFSEIPLKWNEETKTLTIGNRTGSFEGMLEERAFNVVFVQSGYGMGLDPSDQYQVSVSYDGTEQNVVFDPTWDTPMGPLNPDTLAKPEALPRPKSPEHAMVGEWSFDDGEGGLVRDTSGYFNNGMVHGDSGWTAGKYGNAFRFSGSNNYVEIPNNPSLDITNGISISTWVNRRGGAHGNVLNKSGNGNNLPGYSFILYGGNLPQLEIQTAKNAGGTTTKLTVKSTITIPENTWTHLACTWQSEASGGDGIVRIYVNGTLVTAETAANKFTGPIGTNVQNLRLGRSDENEPNYPNYFNGIMDEVRLFNYGVSSAEVQTLYGGSRISTPNVDNITATPQGDSIKLNWDDPADTTGIDGVKIEVEDIDGELSQAYTADLGDETFTVPDLTIGKFYNILVKCVMSDGKESSGVNIVCVADDYSALIDCVNTHMNDAFGWLINRSNAALEGTLKVEVVNKTSGTVKKTQDIPVVLPALDMLQFTADIGIFAGDEEVRVSFICDDDTLAAPLSVDRTLSAENKTPQEAYKDPLRAQVTEYIDKALYTDQSYAVYLSAMYAARDVINTTNITFDEVDTVLAALLLAKEELEERGDEPPVRKKGDVNNDDSINIFDIMEIRDHIFGKNELIDDDFEAADVNDDNDVNIFDIMGIRDHIFGKALLDE